MYEVVVVADSRAHNFDAYKKPIEEDFLMQYRIDYCVARGATIADLRTEVLDRLKYKRSRYPIIIKIAAGINNLTQKTPHEGSSVLKPNLVDISTELLSLRDEIKKSHKAVVTFITIPPAIFDVSQQYKLDNGVIKSSLYSTRELASFQTAHNEAVKDLNKQIKRWNAATQEDITPQTASWDNIVLRPTKRRQSSGYHRSTSRLDRKSLYDGLHGTSVTKQKWFNMLHHSIQQEINKLEQIRRHNLFFDH